MSQRTSGFERQSGDQYMTPEWVARTLLYAVPIFGNVWEPACGDGNLVRAISSPWCKVFATDIDPRFCETPHDFLTGQSGGLMPTSGPFAIITNPPYGKNGRLAEAFTRQAVEMTQFNAGKVGMLLPVDWDSAKGRRDLFEDFPGHVTKITLIERIRWTNLPQSKSSPSANHAWFVWDHSRKGRDMRWLGRIAAIDAGT